MILGLLNQGKKLLKPSSVGVRTKRLQRWEYLLAFGPSPSVWYRVGSVPKTDMGSIATWHARTRCICLFAIYPQCYTRKKCTRAYRDLWWLLTAVVDGSPAAVFYTGAPDYSHDNSGQLVVDV